jgi:hypothetical protein
MCILGCVAPLTSIAYAGIIHTHTHMHYIYIYICVYIYRDSGNSLAWVRGLHALDTHLYVQHCTYICIYIYRDSDNSLAWELEQQHRAGRMSLKVGVIASLLRIVTVY